MIRNQMISDDCDSVADACNVAISKTKEKIRHFIRKRKEIWWRRQHGKRETFEIRHHGLRMRLYFDSLLCKTIYCDGFEWQEQMFLKSYLKPGDTFVDVGSNIGLFSLLAATLVGRQGFVYSFEPCSRTFERLLENIQINHLSNLSCHRLALSDKEGRFELNVSQDGFDAWNSLAQPSAGEKFIKEPVNTITWDTFAKDYNLIGRVAMMKIDVEGWESRVLSGGRETLCRYDAPILQVEFTEQNCRSAGSSCKELYALLRELGYEMFIFDSRLNELIPDPLRRDYPYMNLICIKNLKKVLTRIGKS